MTNAVVKGEVNPLVETDGNQASEEEFVYDPQQMLKKTGKLQSDIIDAIGTLGAQALVEKPALLESVSSFLNGVNNTAVQVTRNNIVGSSMDVGSIADAVYDRMRRDKTSGIKTVEETGRRGKIPTNVTIDLDETDQAIEEGMLEKGLINQTFDEFADKQGLTVVEHKT